jgi:hypothetical protein
MLFRPRKTGTQQRQVPDILLLVSPHFGVVDSWLPILCELKRQSKDISIGAIVTDKILDKINLTDFVTQEANKVIDLVIFKGHRHVWRTAESFEAAALAYTKVRSRAGPLAFCRSIFSPDSVTTKQLALHTKVVLFDVIKQKTGIARELRKMLVNARWFSLPHGLDPLEFRGYSEKEKNKIVLEADRRTIVYAASRAEATIYREWFGIENENVKVVGVPRHCKTWTRWVSQHRSQEQIGYNKYIFVASRAAAANLFPVERKIQALIDIRRIAEEIGAAIVVRLHPNEGVEERKNFEDGLGVEALGKTWVYSASHPIALGCRALFAVTFFSSVAIDMLALGVPVIEACDFSGVNSVQLIRDQRGNITSSYQQLGLVLGARNYDELRRHVIDIVADRDAVMNRLRSAYEGIYEKIPDPIAVITRDIMGALGRG